MNYESIEPVLLEPSIVRRKSGPLPWVGLLLGALAGFFILHPLAMLVRAAHDSIYSGVPFTLEPAFLHSFHRQMWPMMMLYTLLGALVGVVLGLILKRLKENRQRLDTLHQEFELQVATLRHHYKNLAIGIQGLAGRTRRKLESLEKQLQQCAIEDPHVHQECETMARNVEILEEASQRLTQTLGQELLFLKALTSESLVPGKRDFYPLLIHSINDLLNLRFRDKELKVEIDGESLEHCHKSLVFTFEPYTLEVVLQNILSNSMRFGDHLQVEVRDRDGWVRVEIRDNGPGLEVEKLRDRLLAPADRQTADSTHLGLKVSLHLIQKSGGRLSVWSQPGAGAAFIIELPKQP
ncbi:MAG: HAMP domain-containing sensor histidine kinase [Thermodesulfobacteriota bacterium]